MEKKLISFKELCNLCSFKDEHERCTHPGNDDITPNDTGCPIWKLLSEPL